MSKLFKKISLAVATFVVLPISQVSAQSAVLGTATNNDSNGIFSNTPALIVCGCVICLVLIAALVLIVLMRRNEKKEEKKA